MSAKKESQRIGDRNKVDKFETTFFLHENFLQVDKMWYRKGSFLKSVVMHITVYQG